MFQQLSCSLFIFQFARNANTDGGVINAVGLVPWRCFAKTNGTMCSCTVLAKTWVMVKSSCIEPDDGAFVEVHAGGTTESNVEQVVGATIFSPPEPSPKGVRFLQLSTSLRYTAKVSFQKLFIILLEKPYILADAHRFDRRGYQMPNWFTSMGSSRVSIIMTTQHTTLNIFRPKYLRRIVSRKDTVRLGVTTTGLSLLMTAWAEHLL